MPAAGAVCDAAAGGDVPAVQQAVQVRSKPVGPLELGQEELRGKGSHTQSCMAFFSPWSTPTPTAPHQITLFCPTAATLASTTSVGVRVGADTPHWPAPTLSCRYNLGSNPKRVLTKPSVGVKNDGYDNENSDLILYVNDVLINHQPSSNICRKYAIQVCGMGYGMHRWMERKSSLPLAG